ncbi:hypothetical protein [Nostoc sp.]|uniref:hypothetical protein n=1 Tax=Nostoc sp. TaxID=1180 RepID=UPI002FF87AD2
MTDPSHKANGKGFQSPLVRWWVERIRISLTGLFSGVSKALSLGGGLKVLITEVGALVI